MFVLNTLCDLICDVISCCVWCCDTRKISVVYNSIWEDRYWKQEKKRKYGNKNNFYLNLYPKDGLEMEFTAWWRADIIIRYFAGQELLMAP